MTGRPWLSVLVPTLNGEATVAETLASVEANGADGVELIVVDGGSRDATTEIVAAFTDRLPIRMIRSPASTGWTASTNEALAAARAPYACFLHQDDTWAPHRLRVMRALVSDHPRPSLYTSNASFIDARGRTVGAWTAGWPTGRAAIGPVEATERLLIHNFLACPAPVFSTAAARAVGGLDDALWYTADWDFWLKLARLGGVAHAAAPLVRFRVHAGSLTVRGSKERPDFLGQMERVVARHGEGRAEAVRIARYSNAVNAGLAGALHGAGVPVADLAGGAVRLGPGRLLRYLRSARPDQRVTARLRAGLAARA